MQKKQSVMQDTILDKLASFKDILEKKKQSLATGNVCSINRNGDMLNTSNIR